MIANGGHGMPSLPGCPNPLPVDLDSELERLAVLWAKHPTRPRLGTNVAKHRDRLIGLWISDESPPLFIRLSMKYFRMPKMLPIKNKYDVPGIPATH
jgi:hypothetical protein